MSLDKAANEGMEGFKLSFFSFEFYFGSVCTWWYPKPFVQQCSETQTEIEDLKMQSLIWDLPSTTACDIYIFGVLSLFPKVSFLSTWERCNSIRVGECTFAQLGMFNASSDMVIQLIESWLEKPPSCFFFKFFICDTKTLELTILLVPRSIQ